MKEFSATNDYLDPNGTSGSRWAWEFLRRNPIYREEWERSEIGLPSVSSAK